MAPDPAVLDPLERKVVRTASRRTVDLHRPRLHAIRDPDRSVDVAGEHAPLQAVLALVDVPQRVVLGGHADDRDDGPERFLPAQAHVIRDIIDQRGPHQVLVPPPFRSHRRALRDGILHEALDEVRGLGGYHRRDLRVVLGRAHR